MSTGLSAPLAFIGIIGCGSAIQASLIAFALHDDSGRPCKNHSGHFYARGWEPMLEPMHSLVTNCCVVEACVQVRAESSCKANAIKLAWFAEPQPMMSIKALYARNPGQAKRHPGVSDLARTGWIIVQGERNQACLNCWAAADDVNKGPMEHIAQGKRSDTLGVPHSRVSTPCKGKSLNF